MLLDVCVADVQAADVVAEPGGITNMSCRNAIWHVVVVVEHEITMLELLLVLLLVISEQLLLQLGAKHAVAGGVGGICGAIVKLLLMVLLL